MLLRVQEGAAGQSTLRPIFNARVDFSMRALNYGVMDAIRTAITDTYRRLARATNTLIAPLPREALWGTILFEGTLGTPRSTLDETLTATEILDKDQDHSRGGKYASASWVLTGVHPEYWHGRKPTEATRIRTYETEQAIPATARQAISAANAFGNAVYAYRQSTQDRLDPEKRARMANEAQSLLADTNAILDLLEPELGLTQRTEVDPPENLPAVEALAALPPLARAIAAGRARDSADQARTDYADALGAALEELKRMHGRGWTAQVANALGVTPSSIDEALRRYQRRRSAREELPPQEEP